MGDASRMEDARVCRAVPGEDNDFTRECAGIVQNAMGHDDELGREAPSSKVGYGGCGGYQTNWKEQSSNVNALHEEIETPDVQGYVGEGADGKKGKEGLSSANGHGETGDAGDNHLGDRPSKEEENAGRDETEGKSLKSKLKKILSGHHDHKHGHNGPESRLPEMPYNKEEDHGLLSRVKHKIVKSHERHMDGLDPEAWG